MNLWIRSQDKKSLRIVSNINIIHEDGKTFICNYTGIANIKIGTYKTEQRALEVLDEIQDVIISSSYMEINEKEVMTCGSGKVYEMPENGN